MKKSNAQPSQAQKKKKGEKRKSAFRFLRWGSLIPVLTEVGIGVLLFCLQGRSMSLLSIVMGVIFCALAVLLLAFAFGGSRAGFVQLALGTLAIAFSVWLFVQPNEAVAALLIVLTALLFVRGMLGMFYSLSAKRQGGRVWQTVLVGSLILIVCAFVLFFLPMVSSSLQVLMLGILSCLGGAMEALTLAYRLVRPKGHQEAKPQKEQEEQTSQKKQKEQEEEVPPNKKAKRKRTKEGQEEEAPEEKQAEEVPEGEPGEQALPKKKRFFARKM